MRLLSLALALGLVAPSKSEARSRPEGADPVNSPPPTRQNRRQVKRTGLLQFAPLRSPCGRHVVEVEDGAIFVDGRKVHPASGTVHVLAAPSWRPDGDALAWLERRSGETRLVVLPEIARPAETIVWPLPPSLAQDRVHWAGDNRVVVGPEALQPRAVASWSE
jgi:hypothetical protein